MKKELACVWRLAAGDERSQSSRVLHICRRACGKLGRGDQPVPAQIVGASRDDLRIAERRGQESLAFPVLPGYRPLHCLEGLLSGGRTANRTRVYIHTSMTPNFSAPACTHPGPVAALALRPSGACQTYHSPPPNHRAPGGVGACRLCQPSLFQQGAVGAFA